MKLNKIFKVLSLAAVALIATACQDTDAQVEITDVDAPQFLSANLTEEKPIFFGETTIKVAFDKNVGFATKNAQQITINGAAVDKAQVVGVSKELTITKSLDFCNTIALHIPAGIIDGDVAGTVVNLSVSFPVSSRVVLTLSSTLTSTSPLIPK